jgi:hypothetical protein
LAGTNFSRLGWLALTARRGFALEPWLPCVCSHECRRELEIIHQAQPLQFAVDRLQLDAAGLRRARQIHHRLDLQLKHLQVGHRVAVAAVPRSLSSLGSSRAPITPFLIVEVAAQVARPAAPPAAATLAGWR